MIISLSSFIIQRVKLKRNTMKEKQKKFKIPVSILSRNQEAKKRTCLNCHEKNISFW